MKTEVTKINLEWVRVILFEFLEPKMLIISYNILDTQTKVVGGSASEQE